MKDNMDNKGGIDIQSWIVGIVGFTIVWILWATLTPAIDSLTTVTTGTALNLPVQFANIGLLIQKIWNFGMVINAGAWLIFILWSSIKVEVAEYVYDQ
jgi:hypothetical protein